MPRNYGDHSDGFYRRLIIVKFNINVSADKRDADLREKLAVERDGILMSKYYLLPQIIPDFSNFSPVIAYRNKHHSNITLEDLPIIQDKRKPL